MGHASHQSDIPGPARRSWLAPAFAGLLACLALVQVAGSEVSAATLDAAPIDLPNHGAPTLLPEILEALPFL